MGRLRISPNGDFRVAGKSYRIPEHVPPRVLTNYMTLVRPIPDIRGGTSLSAEQRATTEAYLFRRAVAGLIPGFHMDASEGLSAADMRTIHRWITAHRPLPSTYAG
ncbi:MAG TPA: hypothetical protein VLA33_00070 [Gemmatimonadota bacterium]|nr:hypothetical protein [Gemmatimonadota bacterium]